MTTIRELNGASVVGAADQIALWSSTDGDTQRAALSQVLDFMQANLVLPNGLLTQQYAAPSATGFSVAITKGDSWLILTPGATYAAGTIVLPPAPTNQQQVLINTTQTITALTVSPNGKAIYGAPTTLAAGSFFRLRFDATLGAWFRSS